MKKASSLFRVAACGLLLVAGQSAMAQNNETTDRTTTTQTEVEHDNSGKWGLAGLLGLLGLLGRNKRHDDTHRNTNVNR